jgi:hypothetical protein
VRYDFFLLEKKDNSLPVTAVTSPRLLQQRNERTFTTLRRTSSSLIDHPSLNLLKRCLPKDLYNVTQLRSAPAAMPAADMQSQAFFPFHYAMTGMTTYDFQILSAVPKNRRIPA